MKQSNRKIVFSVVLSVALGSFSGLVISKDKPAQKPGKSPEKEWYISNTVSVVDAEGKNHGSLNPAIMGRLSESSDGYDRHDIAPFVSLARSKAAVLFIQNDWGDRSGEYHSDYHGSNRQSDSWVMTVVSTVEGGQVTLSWDGLYALSSSESKESSVISYKEKRTLDSLILERLQLIDLATLEVVEAVSPDGALNKYSFSMNHGETSRNFRWVLGPINSSYFEPASHAMQYIKSQQGKMEARQSRVAKEKANGMFGLPPS